MNFVTFIAASFILLNQATALVVQCKAIPSYVKTSLGRTLYFDVIVDNKKGEGEVEGIQLLGNKRLDVTVASPVTLDAGGRMHTLKSLIGRATLYEVTPQHERKPLAYSMSSCDSDIEDEYVISPPCVSGKVAFNIHLTPTTVFKAAAEANVTVFNRGFRDLLTTLGEEDLLYLSVVCNVP